MISKRATVESSRKTNLSFSDAATASSATDFPLTSAACASASKEKSRRISYTTCRKSIGNPQLAAGFRHQCTQFDQLPGKTICSSMNRDFSSAPTSVQGSIYHVEILFLNGARFWLVSNLYLLPTNNIICSGRTTDEKPTI